MMRRVLIVCLIAWSTACAGPEGDTKLEDASAEELRDFCLWTVENRFKTNMASACRYTVAGQTATTAECIAQREDCLSDRHGGWRDFGDEARSVCSGAGEQGVACAATLVEVRTCYADRWAILTVAAERASCERPGVVDELEVPDSCTKLNRVCPGVFAQALQLTNGSH